LKSILDCDCVGFHVYEHARHFIMCCKRVLGLDTEMSKYGHFIVNNKYGDPVMIRIGHAGVVADTIRKKVTSEEFKEKLEKREKQNRTIISSLDPLSHFSGIRAKLIAYHKFLKQRSFYQRDCKLIQYMTIPKVEIEDNMKELRAAIKENENKIINEFGDKVLQIVEVTPDDDERFLLWAETDILFVTNKIDGVYMSQLEYIAVRGALDRGKKSSVLISEFVGGAKLLTGAIKFNPYNMREMVK